MKFKIQEKLFNMLVERNQSKNIKTKISKLTLIVKSKTKPLSKKRLSIFKKDIECFFEATTLFYKNLTNLQMKEIIRKLILFGRLTALSLMLKWKERLLNELTFKMCRGDYLANQKTNNEKPNYLNGQLANNQIPIAKHKIISSIIASFIQNVLGKKVSSNSELLLTY